MTTKTPEQLLLDTLRADVKEGLAQCTESQNAAFNRMFPKGVDNLPLIDLNAAMAVILRTILKNEQKKDQEGG